jgi:uncharacterized protein
MSRNSTAWSVRLLAIAVFTLLPHASGSMAGQTAAVTPAQAAPFLGEWTIATSSPMGPATYLLSLTSAGDTVRGTVKTANQPDVTVSNIRLSRKSLVLTYSSEFSGMAIPTVLILTPDGSNLRADFSVLDGQFEMSGTGTKGNTFQSSAQRPTIAAPAGGNSNGQPAQPQVARVADLLQMMAALPDSAPTTPKQPRRVLVLARAAGFVHASIPLAARTIEALGQKTGAWTTVITYSAADINIENLRQYDAIFLASTTGQFLDEPSDQAATTARRNALLEFVRGGKGLAGIHAATDSYHGGAPPTGAPANRAVDGGSPLWPDFNRLIGGFFKFHWIYPTQIAVKIDDPENPINAPFTSLNQPSGVRLPRPFSIVDEVYTFNQDSWSRTNAHVLTSIDYAKMPSEVKALEPAPRRTDGDYALSYIRREGKGRVFVEVLGHDESIYKITPMLAHILAGLQYALGDLQADDAPSMPATR